MYSETFKDLCHGTDAESAEVIRQEGFELRGDDDSWCGNGIYFYDIKAKAWWAANRTCNRIKREKRKNVKPIVILADIINLPRNEIFDMRAYKDLCNFEMEISSILEEFNFRISGVEDETERIILLRSMLVGYYAQVKKMKLVIGCFKQRPQEKYKHAIEFSESLDMFFGIETIYCVKNSNILSNIRSNDEEIL